MGSSRQRFRCRSCGAEFPRWYGQCPRCHAWNAVEPVEDAPSPRPAGPGGTGARAVPLSAVELGGGGEVRERTGIAELDRVLGGGLVAGSLVLLGGDPGVGKSTLLLGALGELSLRGPVLYASGEESARQVRLRAERLGLGGSDLLLLATTDFADVERAVRETRARVLVVDSVQVFRAPGVDSLPGSVTQLRALADRALALAKGRGVATILVGHVTREGTLAGPRSLEHLVDTVLYFECDGRSPLRLLRSVKNRFGPAGALGVFEMSSRGLVEVPDASARLLAERDLSAPGTAVLAAMEGNRPVLVEVQALVGRPAAGAPLRSAIGLDRGRLGLLLAVLDKAGLRVGERDVYVSVAGGLRVVEPAADLAVAAALLSSLSGRPLDPGLVLFGELGLAGEVRGVAFPELRLEEAARHGFREAWVPASTRLDPLGDGSPLPLKPLRRLSELVARLAA